MSLGSSSASSALLGGQNEKHQIPTSAPISCLQMHGAPDTRVIERLPLLHLGVNLGSPVRWDREYELNLADSERRTQPCGARGIACNLPDDLVSIYFQRRNPQQRRGVEWPARNSGRRGSGRCAERLTN
jgi:hypothetical protein